VAEAAPARLGLPAVPPRRAAPSSAALDPSVSLQAGKTAAACPARGEGAAWARRTDPQRPPRLLGGRWLGSCRQCPTDCECARAHLANGLSATALGRHLGARERCCERPNTPCERLNSPKPPFLPVPAILTSQYWFGRTQNVLPRVSRAKLSPPPQPKSSLIQAEPRPTWCRVCRVDPAKHFLVAIPYSTGVSLGLQLRWVKVGLCQSDSATKENETKQIFETGTAKTVKTQPKNMKRVG